MNISLEGEDWRSSIVENLTKGIAPKNPLEAKVLRMKANCYTIIAITYTRGDLQYPSLSAFVKIKPTTS